MQQSDLDALSMDALVQLRGRVAAAIERRRVLDDTPDQVVELTSRYTAAGGDPAVLRAALTTGDPN